MYSCQCFFSGFLSIRENRIHFMFLVRRRQFFWPLCCSKHKIRTVFEEIASGILSFLEKLRKNSSADLGHPVISGWSSSSRRNTNSCPFTPWTDHSILAQCWRRCRSSQWDRSKPLIAGRDSVFRGFQKYCYWRDPIKVVFSNRVFSTPEFGPDLTNTFWEIQLRFLLSPRVKFKTSHDIQIWV